MKSLFFTLAWIGWFSLCSLSVHAQNVHENGVAEETLDIKFSSATVLQWFQFIEQKGIHISYDSSQIKLNEKVTLQSKRYTLFDLLRAILSPYDISVKKTAVNNILIQIKGQRTSSLKGHVVNRETGERLWGYTVILQNAMGKRFVCRSNAQGEYQCPVTPGTYTLTLAYVGYITHKSQITLNQDRYLTIKLQPQSVHMNEVVIEPSPFLDDANYKGTTDKLAVSYKDPLASVQFMPGISGSVVNGNLHVNGGERDENQIILDGIPLYHTHHNNSLLALFNGDAVKHVSFYSSFIPAQYEGRLSSVTDVKLKEGDSLKHHQYFNLDMPAASITVDGPLIKNKLTYMFSARHSWIDMFERMGKEIPEQNRTFNDLTCKLAYHIHPETSIQAVVYRSNDALNDSTKYSNDQKIVQWKGGVYSLGLNTLIANKVRHVTKIGFAEYHNQIFAPIIGIDSPIFIEEGMHRYNVKSDFKMKLDHGVDLSWGLKYSQEKFNLLASKDTVENNTHRISQLSLYTNAQLQVNEKLLGSVALNFVSYLPHRQRSYFSLQPRFTLKYFVNPGNTLFVDFSRMEQFYHNLYIDEIPVPLDFRMPSIKGFKPSSSLHLEGGWRHLGQNWFCAISTYYKRRSDILGLRYTILPNEQEWDRFIMKGHAHSAGFKFRFSAQTARWSTDLSFTYSRSKEWFADYDQGQKHPTLHDVPYLFNWGTSYRIAKRSFLTLGGYIKSGYFTNIFIEDFDTDELYRRSKRSRCNYRLDMSFVSNYTSRNQKVKFNYKIGLYNIVGNPKNEEIMDLYSLATTKHFLPYFALNLAF